MRLQSLFVASLFLLVAAAAHAQSGCSDSPECPTAILALVGGVGITASRYLLRGRK